MRIDLLCGTLQPAISFPSCILLRQTWESIISPSQ